jgi:hypothetical protein
MYQITQSLHGIIGEVLKQKNDRDNEKVFKTLELVFKQADTFHKNNRGFMLFHDLNPLKW